VTRRRTGPTQDVIDLLHARSGGMCECCNLYPGEQAHHLLPRRAGGTRRPEINLPSNLIWVTAQCHLAIESNRTQSLKDGLLRSDGVNQFRKPVRLWHGLVRLGDFGDMLPLPGRCRAACAVWTSDNPCDCQEAS
jgi:5-methylcytosine-specific restriction enzyme A